MKRIEEIEKMSLEELERNASGISVPEGFSERIKQTLAAADAVSAGDGRRNLRARYAGLAAALVAAAIAAVVFIPRRTELKDSFDDPLLAYAEVEKTFNYISGKMSGGVEMLREAGPVAGKPNEIIRKINSK